MRDNIEIWAASQHTARNLKEYMTTTAAKPPAKPPPPPSASAAAKPPAKPAAAAAKPPPPPSAADVNTLERKFGHMYDHMYDDVNTLERKFGHMYEMFFAHVVIETKDKKSKYAKFTATKVIDSFTTYKEWLTPRIETQFNLDEVIDRKATEDWCKKIADFMKKVQGKINISPQFIRNIEEVKEISYKTNDDMWPMYLSSIMYKKEESNLNDLVSSHNIYPINFQLEIDLGGHCWIDNTSNSFNLNFGEIKSGSSITGINKGICQILRLGYIAIWMISMLYPTHKPIVNGTLFIYSNIDDVYPFKMDDKHKKDFNNKITNVVKNFNAPAKSGTFTLTIQITHGIDVSDRKYETVFTVPVK